MGDVIMGSPQRHCKGLESSNPTIFLLFPHGNIFQTAGLTSQLHQLRRLINIKRKNKEMKYIARHKVSTVSRNSFLQVYMRPGF